MEINLYSAKSAMDITNQNPETCEKILELLVAEIPKFISQLSEASVNGSIRKLRDLIHGMIGAFHYTGANTVKQQLKIAQTTCKNNPESALQEIELLIDELRALEKYLSNNIIKF